MYRTQKEFDLKGKRTMSNKITFSEDQITGLFGELAAEDEEIVRFKNSFFKGTTYDKIHNDRPLRILVAHKGV